MLALDTIFQGETPLENEAIDILRGAVLHMTKAIRKKNKGQQDSITTDVEDFVSQVNYVLEK